MSKRMKSFKRWLVECICTAFLPDHFFEAVFGFGKHRGSSPADIPADYLRWALDNVTDPYKMTPQLRAEIQQVLGVSGAPQVPQARPTGPTLGFGKHRGVPLSQVPPSYLQWALETIDDPGRMPPNLKAAIQQVLGGAAAPERPEAPQAAGVPKGADWYLTKTIREIPALKLPADVDLAMAKVDKENWKFVALDADEQRMWDMGTMPVADIGGSIERRTDEQGGLITAKKPRDLLKIIKPPGAEDTGVLPEHKITPEGRKIEERFQQMLASEGPAHMIINALAGTGKTTTLRHLAWKFGQSGQKWLYLVFNSKNQEEASERGVFPKASREHCDVTVRTTNGFGGDILDANQIAPTQRIIQFTYYNKASMIADGTQFQAYVTNLGIPNPERMPSQYRSSKEMWGLLRGIRYQFKQVVLKLVGLVKSFAVDPRKEDQLESAIDNVADQYDLDTELEESKDRLEKMANPQYYNEAISSMMGVDDFLGHDFTDQIKKATIWMLQKTMPHEVSQEFLAKGERRKGGRAAGRWEDLPEEQRKFDLKTMRDFNDDLWFSAIHADELDWTKPQKWDVVLADEVQDFNEAQKIMLEKLSQTGAKIVAVGDPFQSIYRFRGADAKAFQNLSSTLQSLSADPQGAEQTLSKNFRSKEEVLKHVRKKTIVKNLERGKPYKRKGNVTDCEYQYDDIFSQLKNETEHTGGEPMKQTAFIARTNEPLAHAALELLTEGIPFVIIGKDIAGDLINHLAKVSRINNLYDDSGLDELIYAMREYHEDKREKWGGEARKSGQLKEVAEVTNALTSAAEQLERGSTIGDFKAWLKARLGGANMDTKKGRAKLKRQIEEQNPVVLTTAHKAKGMEYERVYILRDDLFPHPKALKSGIPAELEQEENARYVAYTRAMDELHIIDPEGQPGYEKGK